MDNVEYKSHQHILEWLLAERKILKTDFAVKIGFTRTNYSPRLNQPMYSQKLIQKICAALEVDPSTFPMHGMGSPAAIQVNESGENVNQKNFAREQERTDELLSVYRSLIAAKDNEIAMLREQVERLKSKLS